MHLPHSVEGNLMGVFVRVVNVGFTSELCAAALSSSVIVWVGCPAGPVTVTAAVCSSSPPNFAAVMLPNFLTCSTKPSLFCVMTMSLLSSRQSSSSNSSGVLSVCSDLSCLAVMLGACQNRDERKREREGCGGKKNKFYLLVIVRTSYKITASLIRSTLSSFLSYSFCSAHKRVPSFFKLTKTSKQTCAA